MKDSWDFLLSEFRRLGGIAENICQKEGEYGRGIFSVNPSLRSRIFTPSKLFIKKDDIYLKDNKLRIKKDKKYDQEIRDFFNFYQDNFSWGTGGRETTEAFEKGLSLFNSNLKKLIKKYILVDIEERHKGEWNNVIKNKFLDARSINYKGTSFIVPIWDLVNHKVKSLNPIINKDGISTPNYPASNSEIRFSYNDMSAINRFFYGFFSEETIVFSVPFTLNVPNKDLYISCKGECIKDDSMKIVRSGNQIILDGLPIADENHPRLPFDYFDEILSRIGYDFISKDLLIKILQFNISIRKKIIDESDFIKNEVSKILCKVLDYEISLISSYD
tara:strand:+ start:234 stop:1226 length:993 start_codon:yes stop_codon:yes gene_type:complete